MVDLDLQHAVPGHGRVFDSEGQFVFIFNAFDFFIDEQLDINAVAVYPNPIDFRAGKGGDGVCFFLMSEARQILVPIVVVVVFHARSIQLYVILPSAVAEVDLDIIDLNGIRIVDLILKIRFGHADLKIHIAMYGKA